MRATKASSSPRSCVLRAVVEVIYLREYELGSFSLGMLRFHGARGWSTRVDQMDLWCTGRYNRHDAQPTLGKTHRSTRKIQNQEHVFSLVSRWTGIARSRDDPTRSGNDVDTHLYRDRVSYFALQWQGEASSAVAYVG